MRIFYICKKNTSNSIGSGIETKYMEIDEEIKNTLKENFYDLIIVTDIFELTSDIFKFLNLSISLLRNGKVLTSVNTKWNLLLYFLNY